MLIAKHVPLEHSGDYHLNAFLREYRFGGMLENTTVVSFFMIIGLSHNGKWVSSHEQRDTHPCGQKQPSGATDFKIAYVLKDCQRRTIFLLRCRFSLKSGNKSNN